jgi:hypothetical protein
VPAQTFERVELERVPNAAFYGQYNPEGLELPEVAFFTNAILLGERIVGVLTDPLAVITPGDFTRLPTAPAPATKLFVA